MNYEQMQALMKQRLRKAENVTEEDIRSAVEDHHLEQQGLWDIDPEMITEMDNAASNYLAKRHVPTVGYVPPNKLAGTYRWFFGNVNGLTTNRARNFKSETLHMLKEEYKPDGLGFVELGLDVRHLKPSESLATILNVDGTTRSVTATNRYQPKLGKKLQGGCGIVTLGEICQYVKITNGGNDPRELGRICSIILQANPQHRT
jgi:hypothetical protein